MKILLALIIISFIPYNLLTQPYDNLINPYWYFYSDNHLSAISSGMGRTGIGSVGDISSAYMNPASFEIEKKVTADIQYTYRSNQPWLIWLGVNDVNLKQNIFSGSAAIGYKILKNLNAGFVYSNPYSFNFDMGEIIRTNEYGQEIGRYEAIEKYSSHNFSIPVSYKISKFRFGLSFNYTMHRRYFSMETNDVTVKFYRFNIMAGIIAEITEGLTFGLKFYPESSGEADVVYSSNNFVNEKENVKLPLQFGTGISYIIPQNKLNFSADYTFIQGSQLSSQVNQHLFNFGVQYPLNKNWTIRGGFFNSADPRDLNRNYGNKMESYSQLFVTAGASAEIDNVTFSLALMDSHISSATVKYTFLTGGINFKY